MLNVRKLPVRGGVGQPVGKSFSRFHRTLFTIVVTSMVSGCAAPAASAITYTTVSKSALNTSSPRPRSQTVGSMNMTSG